MSLGSGNTSTMEYNWLSPHAGIKVSNICFGTMTFGTKDEAGLGIPGNTDEAQSHALLDRFVELGGNFIDTANIYTNGESEQIIGTWLKKRERSSLVVATKVRFNQFNQKGFTDGGLSRSSILTNLEQSLKRLQTDYIDVYYSHAWDAGVKLEETLRTFNDVVRSGKVRYFGISNVTGYQLQKIVDYCKFLGFDQSVVLQAEYSLLERGLELEVLPPAREEGVTLVPYGALKGGLLTGKFKRDHEKDVQNSLAGSRLAWAAEKPAERNWGVTPYVENYREVEEYWKLMDTLAAIGKKHGKTQSQVAIRWVLQRDPVSSVIIGAKTLQQLEDNMGAAAGWKLTDEEMEQLTEAANFAVRRPVYPYSMVEKVNYGRYRKV